MDEHVYIEFFPARRNKTILVDWRPLLSENNEKRVRIDLLIAITGSGMSSDSLPNWVRPGYERMDVDDSVIKKIPFSSELEGFSMEAFSTDKGQFPIEIEMPAMGDERENFGRRHVLLTGCSMTSFELVRETVDGQSVVALKFALRTMSDDALVVWCRRYHGATFWSLFEKQQSDLPLEGKSDSAQMTLDQAVTSEVEPEDLDDDDDDELDGLGEDEPAESAQETIDNTPQAPVGDESDPLLKDAIALTREEGKGSTSLLQRRLRIGYGRAANLLDTMEKLQVVGPANGPAPREVIPEPKKASSQFCDYRGYCKQPVFHEGEHDPNPADAVVDEQLRNKHKRGVPKTRVESLKETFSKPTNESASR